MPTTEGQRQILHREPCELRALRPRDRLRQRLYAHLHRLGLRFYAESRTGEITSRLTNDVSKIQSAATSSLSSLLTETISFIGAVGLMLFLNWRLSLVIFATVPAVSFLTRWAGVKLRQLARSIQDQLADTTAIAEEAIQGIRVVKAFAREPYEVARYSEGVAALFEKLLQVRELIALVVDEYGGVDGVVTQGLGRFTLGATVSVLRGTNLTRDEALHGMPADRLELSAGGDLGSWGVLRDVTAETSVDLVREQDRFPTRLDEDGVTVIPVDFVEPPEGYALLGFDLGGEIAMGPSVMRVSLSVDNLLDTRYRDYLSRYRYFALDPVRNVVLRLALPFGA